MAVSQQQKVDFLLKKLGFTKTKTGLAVDSTLTGTKKAGFAEAIPSPLIIANSSVWNEADSIPATPPGSDTNQVKVYLAASSGHRMTVDSTVAGNRAFIAFSTYNDTSSTRLNNWIDTQFGAGYLIKVYKGDPNSGGVQLSAAGSGANDGWFFDYSAGVLNFNDTNVPSGVSGTNIYVVGYRYIGQTGAPTSGISTFSFLDLSVERNLDVGVQGGISTFRNNIDLNADLDVDGHTNLDNVSVAGVTTFAGNVKANSHINLPDNSKIKLGDSDEFRIHHDNAGNSYIVEGGSGNLFINADYLRIQDSAGNNKLRTSTAGVNIPQDFDVDGHTNLDNVSIAGVTTFSGAIDANNNLDVAGITTLGSGASGAVTLQYQGATKLNTASWGASVWGVLQANNLEASNGYVWIKHDNQPLKIGVGADLQLIHDGSESFINNHTSDLNINAPTVSISTNFSVGGISTFSGNVDINADIDVDGHTELDNVNVSGIITSAAATVNGETILNGNVSFYGANYGAIWRKNNSRFQLNDNAELTFGTSNDTTIKHNNSNLLITNTTGNIDVTGNVLLNNDLDVDGHTNLDNVSVAGVTSIASLTSGRVILAGTGGKLEDSNKFTFDGTTLGLTGNANVTGNLTVGGVLTYEDVKNVDAVGLITARSGIRVTSGVIEAQAGENKIPSLYSAMGNLPSAGSYHGMFAHVHATGRGYFAHAGNWLELVNKEINGVVGTGTETYNIGNLVSTSSTATSLNVTGVTTAVTLDVNGDLDVDGHTNLDNVSVAGVTTFSDNIHVQSSDDTLALFESTDGLAQIQFKDNGSNANLPTLGIQQNSFYFNNMGSTTLRIAPGKVGVNEAAPLADFHVNQNDAHSSTYYLDSDAGVLIENINGAGTKKSVLKLIGNSAIVYGSSGSGSLIFAQRQKETASFDNNGNFSLNYDLDVDGHTNLDNVSIAGVTTFTGAIDANGDLDVDGHTNLDNVSIAGVTTFTGNIGGTATFQDIDVDGHTNLDNVSIAGVTTGTTINATTFVGDGDFVELDVDGHTNLDNVSIAGVTTFASGVKFGGSFGVHDGTTGSNGQYLRATGAGVTWANFPTMRTSQTTTASSGQTVFNFTYNVGYLDVFVNGVKLTSSEFTATNGSNVILAVGSFVGDIVELVSYFTTSYAAGSSGLGEIVEDTTPQLGGNLDMFNKSITGTGNINIAGIITATNFVGDGSGLTGITASGSGVVIKDSGSTVGTAGTINFGDNLSVSPASAGIVTVTGSAGVSTSQFDVNKLDVSGISTFKGAVDINADIDVDGHTNLDNVSVAGVVTATTFVGALTGNVTGNVSGNATGLTGNPTINVTDLDVDGHTNLDNVSVAGVTTFTGAISASDIRSNALTLKNAAGSASYAVFSNGGSALLKHNNTDRLETSASGVTVTGTVAATSYTGDGSQLTGVGVQTSQFNVDKLDVSGISTFSGNIDVNADLDVDGHTNLDNVSIAGVVTTTDDINIDADNKKLQIGDGQDLLLRHDGTHSFVHTKTGNLSLSSVQKVQLSKASGEGSGDYEKMLEANVNGSVDLYFDNNLKFKTTNQGIEVTGHSELDNVNIVGVTTTNNHINIDADNKKLQIGDSQDLKLRHDGSHSFVHTETGNLSLSSQNKVQLSKASGDGSTNYENMLQAFADGAVELYYDNVLKFATTNTGINVTGNVVGDGLTIDGNSDLNGDLDVDGHTNLDNVSIAGVVTATTFIGDGSGLTGITASGSGVVIKHDGSTVGTAGTINFGTNLDVSAISGGAVTITASGGSGSGISTISGVVNIANDLDVDGHTNLDNVSVAGVSTFAGSSNFSSNVDFDNGALVFNSGSNRLDFADNVYARFGNSQDLQIYHDGSSNHIAASNGNLVLSQTSGTFRIMKGSTENIFKGIVDGAVELFYNNSNKLQTTSTGINVTGNVVGDGLTIDGNADLNGDLDVDGHTNLDNVSIAGFTTVTQDLDVDGHTNLDNATIAGVSTFIGNVNLNTDLDVDGHTNLDNVSIAGVSTFSGNLHVGIGATVGIGSTAYVHKIAFKDAGSNNSTDTAAIGNQGSSLKFIGGSVQNGVWGNSGLKIAGNGASTLTGPESGCSLEVVSSENTRVLFKGSANTGLDFDSSSPNNGVANYIRSDKNLIFYTGYGSAAGVTTNFEIGKKEGSTFYSSVGIRTNYYPLGDVSISMDAISGIVTATKFIGDGSSITNTQASVGITTNLSGTFTASAGSPSTINTFGYGSGDLVVEYTIYIKNGSDFQTQKLLAMRDGTTIHSTQFAVMFSSSLLVQCDATISSGNILLRATPETGVSGSTTYKVKREVM